MPSWSTRAKDDGGKKNDPVKEKMKHVGTSTKSTPQRTDARPSTSLKELAKTLSESVAERRKKDGTGGIKKDDRRHGHYGLLDAITPKPRPQVEASSSNSHKTPSSKPVSLSFTKSAPDSATSRKRGARRGKSSTKNDKEKEKEKEPEEEDGEWDEFGFWRSNPKPQPVPESLIDDPTETMKRKEEEEVDELEDTQVTPSNKGKGKDLPTSSPSPPPTKLRTPALQHTAINPRIVDDTPLPLPPPQTRLHRLKDPDFLFSQNVRKDVSHQDKTQTKDTREKAKEPLFLAVSISPDSDQEPHQREEDDETEEEVELIESPIQRPFTRRSLARLSISDDEDSNQGQGIPPPSFLAERERKKREEEKRAQKAREKKGKINLEATDSDTSVSQSDDRGLVLVPDSNPQGATPARHFGIEITPFVNNSPSQSRKNNSKSSRKSKTYGKGRSHAYQHGNPLPHATSQRLTLTPPPAPVVSSYRGAKRKGSTSIWRDSSSSTSPEPDAVVGFDQDDDMGYETEPPRPGRKRKRWTRNGPPPDERLLGLFGEDEDEPHRCRRKRGRTPRYPVTTVFKWPNSDEDVKVEDQADYDPDTARRRKKRRKREIERRHRVMMRHEPRLQLTRSGSCRARIKDYVGKIGQTLTLPKKPLHASKAVRVRSYKRMQGVPKHACKTMPTISYSEYVARYRRSPNSASSASRPSGGRVNELISAGRRARFEMGFRRQRPITRDITPKLPLVPLVPSQEDPQIEDEIEVEPSQRPFRRRGSSLGQPLVPKNVPRLKFTKNQPPSVSNGPQSSTDPSERIGVDVTSILGHLFTMPPSRQNPRREMPQAFRKASTPLIPFEDIILSDDTPETSRRNPQNYYEAEDPIQPWPTQDSQLEVIGSYSGRTHEMFGGSPVLPSPPERLSETFRRLDGIYEQDMSQHVTRPTIREDMAQPKQVRLEATPLQERPEITASPIHQAAQLAGENGTNKGDLPEDDMDWAEIGKQITPSQWTGLDVHLAQVEEEIKARKSSKSRETSEKAKSAIVSRRASQTSVNPPNTKRGMVGTSNSPKTATEIAQPAARAPSTPGRSDPVRRMTGMEVTQHLLQLPLDPSIAQTMEKTFVNTSSRGNSAERPSTSTSRKAKREERAKRVHDKRVKDKKKEKEKQTLLNFDKPRSSTSRSVLAEVRPPSDTEEEEEIEKIETPRQNAKPQNSRKQTLSEAYRNIHPPPSPPRLKSRASAPSRYSLGDTPVVKNFKDAKQPSAKSLSERNRKLSQEALGRVFRPPIRGTNSFGPGTSSTDIAGGAGATYEPTEVSRDNTQGNITRQPSTNSIRSIKNSQPYINAWRTEIEGTEHPNERGRNQGGNPFEEDLRMFEHSPTEPSVIDQVDQVEAARNRRKEGKRYLSVEG
ncbi:hypothetical protein I203_106412 [Kwoniella mangroviensis CBS 8507]|uniref:uncharacterized protein n=1 Tax=Kwoniella mangroviensis CBS 8507 TaxID=1296122 RepID=UPI00080CC94F|nr:uncharacterized protein I203_07688 [Kwoniella mangroviensis CBS 8507]OCF63263.1 hypothetical protein I203_07688 [Kwoniella mangroviensis CBS 8507]